MDTLLAQKFLTRLMRGGNKATCERILRNTFENIHRKTKQPPLTVVYQAVQNVRPALENRHMHVGHRVVRVPSPIDPRKSLNYATRWIVANAREGDRSFPCTRL